MVDFAEIPLELQLKETNHSIQDHLAKYAPVLVTDVSLAIPRHNGQPNICGVGNHNWPV